MSILVNADEHRDEILKAAIAKSRKATVASGAAGAAAGGAVGAGAGHLLAEASKVGAHSKAGRIMRAKGAVGTGAALGLTAAGTAAGIARLRRKPVEKSAAGTAGRAMKRATPMPKKPLVAHPDDAKRGINRYRQNDINREGMTSLRLDEVGKSAAGTAGRTVRDFKRGAQRGVRLAGKGHTHTGQIGSGVAGRPTFSVRSGMPPAGRAGIHAGVLAGNAPTLAAGATVGAGLEHRKVHKGLTNGDVAREVLATPKPKVFGKKRDAAERTRARGVLANPKVSGAEDDYWLKGVSKSAFGVELGKALGDDNSVRGAVRGNYVPPSAAVAPVKKIKLALGPAKSALIAAAKK